MTQSAFYYHEVNRRQRILITDELRQLVKTLADEMHQLYRLGKTPKAEMKKNCPKCSLYEICMPRLTNRKSSVSHYMQVQVAMEETL
ncbi:MAG: Dna2/Cas4 domain-containing protein [Peptococcaceae bacterium]